MRRATIIVCAKSGTEVPRYGVRFSATNPTFLKKKRRPEPNRSGRLAVYLIVCPRYPNSTWFIQPSKTGSLSAKSPSGIM
jgi:hypothetical protein